MLFIIAIPEKTLAAYLDWFSRGQGWIAALTAGTPIAILLSQGYLFIYKYSAMLAFDLLATAALFIILPNGKKQYHKTALVAVLQLFLLPN